MIRDSRPILCRCRLISWLVVLAFGQALSAAEVYVSPDGNDQDSGTQQAPWATIQHARDVVRAQIAGGMASDITVHLGAGNYFIEQPVVFDDRDSGSNGHTITYQGAPNLATRIYGGRRITNWTPLNDKEHVATVTDLQQHYTLYENDRAANGGIFHVFQDATQGDWRKSGTQLIYRPRSLPITDQVVVLGTTKDVLVVMGRSKQQIVSNIVFDGLHMIGSDFAAAWLAGATYNGTWEGEYDGVQWGGKTLGDNVVRPDMRHGQFFIENARNVVIRNSRLYGAGFMGAFFNRWAQENRVENCWIEGAGCDGLFFHGWECGRGGFATVAESYVNKNNVVANNVFLDIGRFANDGGGIYLTFSGDNLVEHNVFHGITHYGVTLKGWRPQLINTLYRYSLMPVRDLNNEPPYGATWVTYYDGYVVTQANQGAELLHSRNNIIRHNDFSQIARSGDDMGMISMWGAGTGNCWESNACHDGVNVSGWDNSWMHCLFNDDGSHQATVRGNVMYWIAGGGASRAIMAKGNNQNNIHNIIADCELSSTATIGPYAEEAHNMVWSHNIVASRIGALYNGGYGTETVGGVTYPILQAAEKNLYFYKPIDPAESSASGAASLQQQVASRNQAGGLDGNSIYADPKFDRQRPWWDARYTDYRLQTNSPALALGFQETDMSQIGIQAGFPFDLTEMLGAPANRIRLAADFTRIFKNRITNQQVQSRYGSPLSKDSWTRYDGVDFGNGRYEQFQTHLQWATAAQSNGTAIEIRLDAPDGTLIGAVPHGQDTCRIATTNGRHDVFLVFPNENVQALDWFIFQPRIIWSGGGSDNNWTTAANWSGPVTAGETLYFGASGRTTPSNDFPAGSDFAGLAFDAAAPAYTLVGNGITLTGNLVNSSANDQAINLPVTLSGTGRIQVDTGAKHITLGGSLGGAAGGLTKTGTGTLTLAAISYTGDTIVENGTLVLTMMGLSRFSNVTVGTTAGASAVLDLRHGLTDRVGKLFIDGVQMADGTYGSSASAATHKDDSAFRGTGMLFLQSGPCPPTYTTRADGHTLATFDNVGTGTWTVPAGVYALEVVVVGGGGAGAAWSSGGGAGGMYANEAHAVTPGSNLQVAVGAGGTAGNGNQNGSDGGPSRFGPLLAYGGVHGGFYDTGVGGDQGGYSVDGGTTVVSGNLALHLPAMDGNWQSGAGAGGPGVKGNSAAGGAGVSNPITGTAKSYAAGGGANAHGLGGSGIGGNGATALWAMDATAGTANTGSGGGGGWGGISANGGGSGIVIVAYQANPVTPTTLELTSSANPAGNGQSVTFAATVMNGGVVATGATGTCVFKVDGAVMATVPVANGKASHANSPLAPGTHTILAFYSGDVSYAFSSASLTQICGIPDSIVPTCTTRGDGKTLATFTSGSGLWTVPVGVSSVEVLVVGGGGSGAAGATWTASGGGAGGLYENAGYAVSGGNSVAVTVGQGGAARGSYAAGNTGGDSVLDNIIAYGGAGGGYDGGTARSHSGGAHGGYSTNNGGTITPGNAGGGPSSSNGGGGAGHVGWTGGYGGRATGGDGREVSITGTATYYAGGGGGGYSGALNQGGLGGGGDGCRGASSGPGWAGGANTGGGGGASRDHVNSGAGGSGVVILAYRNNYATWAVARGLSGGPGAVGSTGIPNLVLYALNLNPNGSNGSPGILTGNVLSYGKRAEAVANGDVHYAIEESDDLGLTDPWAEVPSYTVNDTDTISWTLPTSKGKCFARLVARQVP